MWKPVFLLTALGVSACAPPGYTPAARMITLETATAPAAGQTDVQLDLAGASAVFGPEIMNADARVRHGLERWLAIDAEAGIIHADEDTQGYDPNALTGRVGVHVHAPDPDAVRVALIAGVGGGRSAAVGGWVSGDLGGVVMTNTEFVRPFLGADLFTNHPIDPPMVGYQTSDGPASFRLHDTYGYRGTFGVELGPDDEALIVACSLADAYRDDGRDEAFFSVGLGVRWTPGK
jgi:hypothetical protein